MPNQHKSNPSPMQPPSLDHLLMRGAVFAVQAAGKTPEQLKEMFARAILMGFHIGTGTIKITDDTPWHGSD